MPADPPPPAPKRECWLEQALTDARNAVRALEAGNWVVADALLKLASDELGYAGVLKGDNSDDW